MARRRKTVEKITLTGLADRGKSIGRTEDGVVYFIDDAVPGDVVDALIYKKKKGVGFGRVTHFHEKSPHRADPFCDHFGNCGGCKWQHLQYQEQLNGKEKVVFDAFERIAKVSIQEKFPILGAAKNRYYRNKMEYSFSNRRWIPQDILDSGVEVDFSDGLGFHAAGSFDKVVDIEQCHLQDNRGNEIRNFIRDYAKKNEFTFYNPRSHVGFLRNFIIRNNREDEWMMNFVFGERDQEKIDLFLAAIQAAFPQIKSFWYTINKKVNDTILDQKNHLYNGADHIVESIGHVKFKIGPKSFFQTNTYQAEELYATVAEFADLQGTENIYDLYTGLGSIALYIANKCKHVVGIEEIPEAIADAKSNMELNAIENATFYAGDVKDILTDEFATKHGKPDLLITDPPRVGMHKEVVQMLLQLRAPKLVYVSCNPSTQARDIQLLSEAYDIIKVKPVDMFPHTHHIENVALLKLRS